MPTSRKPVKARTVAKTSEVLFAPAAIQRLEQAASLPAKFQRLLDQYDLSRICQDSVVAIKIHVGGGLGFTTIPPLFVRLLVEKIQAHKPKSIFLTDGSSSVAGAVARGYTAEVLGAPIVGAAGVKDQFFYTHKVGLQVAQGRADLRQHRGCGHAD